MKKALTFIYASSIFLWIGCAPTEEPTKEFSKDELLGTWRLVKTIEIGHEDSTGRKNSDEKFYIKHITPTNFTWAEYDKNLDQLVGTGGGTYTLEGNTYTEDIKFYYPPGSSERGQAIPFTATKENGLWRHTGYVKLYEFDPETGENMVVDSAIIDEMWEKVVSESEVANDLLGTWELMSFKTEGDSVFLEHPDFIGYVKHITPTHFSWTYYNKDGDEVVSAGGGTYTFSGDTYTEKIQLMHPQSSSDQVGTVLPFNVKIDGDTWYHSGYIKRISVDSLTGEEVEVSSKLEEIWKRVEGSPAM